MSDPKQTGSRSDVSLPATFGRGFLRAVEEEFGAYSLHVLQAGLEGGGQRSRATDAAGEMLVTHFAALQHAIRDYYGTGARSGLNRVGRRIWRSMLATAPLSQRLGMLSLRFLPAAERRRKGLEFLTGWLSLPDRPMTVQAQDGGLQVRDPFGPTAAGQRSDEPLCWVMVGLIQEAILWASGEDAEVTETICRAQGAEACLFHVQG